MGGELGGLGTTALEGDIGTVSEVRGQAAEDSESHRTSTEQARVTLVKGYSLPKENYRIDFLALNSTAWNGNTGLICTSLARLKTL